MNIIRTEQTKVEETDRDEVGEHEKNPNFSDI